MFTTPPRTGAPAASASGSRSDGGSVDRHRHTAESVDTDVGSVDTVVATIERAVSNAMKLSLEHDAGTTATQARRHREANDILQSSLRMLNRMRAEVTGRIAQATAAAGESGQAGPSFRPLLRAMEVLDGSLARVRGVIDDVAARGTPDDSTAGRGRLAHGHASPSSEGPVVSPASNGSASDGSPSGYGLITFTAPPPPPPPPPATATASSSASAHADSGDRRSRTRGDAVTTSRVSSGGGGGKDVRTSAVGSEYAHSLVLSPRVSSSAVAPTRHRSTSNGPTGRPRTPDFRQGRLGDDGDDAGDDDGTAHARPWEVRVLELQIENKGLKRAMRQLEDKLRQSYRVVKQGGVVDGSMPSLVSPQSPAYIA
jgi:hypothetical protein